MYYRFERTVSKIYARVSNIVDTVTVVKVKVQH